MPPYSSSKVDREVPSSISSPGLSTSEPSIRRPLRREPLVEPRSVSTQEPPRGPDLGVLRGRRWGHRASTSHCRLRPSVTPAGPDHQPLAVDEQQRRLLRGLERAPPAARPPAPPCCRPSCARGSSGGGASGMLGLLLGLHRLGSGSRTRPGRGGRRSRTRPPAATAAPAARGGRARAGSRPAHPPAPPRSRRSARGRAARGRRGTRWARRSVTRESDLCSSISRASLRAISTGRTSERKARLNVPSTRPAILLSMLLSTLMVKPRSGRSMLRKSGSEHQPAARPGASGRRMPATGAQRGDRRHAAPSTRRGSEGTVPHRATGRDRRGAVSRPTRAPARRRSARHASDRARASGSTARPAAHTTAGASAPAAAAERARCAPWVDRIRTRSATGRDAAGR